jgi:hypothetical protein
MRLKINWVRKKRTSPEKILDEAKKNFPGRKIFGWVGKK